MIARYRRPEMARIWEDRTRYQKWLRVELAVCEALATRKIIPPKDWRVLKKRGELLLKKGGVDPARVEFHENKTLHDVIAFTTAVAEKIGPASRYIHFGLTSSDVVDTSLSLLIQESGEILLDDVRALLGTLKKQALRYQKLPTIGRSHGIFAEPTSFGLKFLGWYMEWKRNLERLENALENLRTGKLSGAVGVNAHFDPAFEKRVLEGLGLKRETVSTQVIPRDRHAEFLGVLAICGSSMERVAVELRHLQRSEVGEVMEGFRKGQKGSSAMPHKRNPISSENLSGCARMLRAYAQTGFENISLWHERDISHSSVERVFFPDAMQLMDYALCRLNSVLSGLVVCEDRVLENLNSAGNLVYSGHYLLALVQKGVRREDAYAWVQECAMGSLSGGVGAAVGVAAQARLSRADFVELLLAHGKISRYLSPGEIKKLGSLEYQLRNVKRIYEEAL